jgi:diguanylate cyclase (GGDEF)-like protein
MSVSRKYKIRCPGDKYRAIFDSCPVAIIQLDYSSLKNLSRQLETQTVTNIRQFLSENPQLVKKTFRSVTLVEANEAAYRLYGVKGKNELLGALRRTFTTTAMDVLVEQFVSVLAGEAEFTGEFKYKSLAAGKIQDVFMRISVPRDHMVTLARVIVTLEDITVWKRIERQLRKRAQLDGLTKLLNHTTIMQRLEEELIRAKRYGLSLSCLMVDLDHFKVINDKFGHPRGDVILRQVATMIKNAVRRVDIVGRYGGDEFLLILPETKPENARFVAMRIHKMFSTKVFKYQQVISFHISLSIGITGYPSKRVKDCKDLISLADKAMYMAKKSGRNRIAIV